MKRRRIVILAILASIGTITWMWLGGLVTYVPGTLSANDMQNIYLSRILWYGLLSVILQLIALGLVLDALRRHK